MLSLLPITLLGIFGKDVTEAEILAHPMIYLQGTQDFLINNSSIFYFIIRAIVNSGIANVVIFYGTPYITSPQGFTENLEVKSFVIFIVTNLWLYLKIFGISINNPLRNKKIFNTSREEVVTGGLILLFSSILLLIVCVFVCSGYFGYDGLTSSIFINQPVN